MTPAPTTVTLLTPMRPGYSDRSRAAI
jgi:hypothetical protein